MFGLTRAKPGYGGSQRIVPWIWNESFPNLLLPHR